MFTGIGSFEQPSVTFPTIGALPETIDLFMPVMRKWLSVAPGLTRLAYGNVLLQLVADRVAGYKLADRYLHSVELDPESMFEFVYQVNRPRTAPNYAGLKINRLVRWSVAYFQPLSLAMVAGQNPRAIATQIGKAVSAVRIEQDMNTDSERAEQLPREDLVGIADLLVEFGNEIVDKGDVK